MRASVEALAFMCMLCFSPSLQNRTFDTGNPQQHQATHAADKNHSRKRKAVISKESIGSTLQCWSKIQPVKNENSWTNVAGVEAGKLQLLAEYSTSDS